MNCYFLEYLNNDCSYNCYANVNCLSLFINMSK